LYFYKYGIDKAGLTVMYNADGSLKLYN